jgi:hypothetical protein
MGKDKLNKIKKILEIDSDPKNAIFELSESKVDKKEFNEHSEENHSEHQDLYQKIEEIELTPGEKGDKGEPGIDGINGKDGVDGKDGKDGKSGERGKIGLTGLTGEQGIKGEKGDKGDNGIGLVPEHEWKGTSLRFKQGDKWGEWTNLQGVEGLKGRSLGGHSEYYIDNVKIGSSQTFNFSTGDGITLTNSSGNGRTGVNFKADESWFNDRYLRLDTTNDPLTGDLDLGDNKLENVEAIDFNLSPTSESQEGRLMWDNGDGTLMLGMPGGNVKLQIGQEGLVKVRNVTGSTLENGCVVYVTGSQGNILTVGLADNTDSDKLHILGMVTEDITNNNNGFVAIWGKVRGSEDEPIDTSGLVEGDDLYLDTAGGWTSTHPSGATNGVVKFGWVIKVHATDGIIMMTNPQAFTLGNNFDGTMRQSIINKSDGTSAAVGFTAVNDAGHFTTIGMGGTNNTVFPDVSVVYAPGYNDHWQAVDGAKDFVWYTDPTDSHDFSSLNYERMRLTSGGNLELNNTGQIKEILDPTDLQDAMTLNRFYEQNELVKEPTGFTVPGDVIVTGDSDTRTVTLTGTVEAYYRGVLNETIVSGWTSPAHSATTGTGYFLMYDGTTIEWVDFVDLEEDDFFTNLLIAVSFYDNVNSTWVYQRECHGFMQWQVHRSEHRLEGTYRQSGGGLDDYVLDSTTLTDRRPSVEATHVFDEDLETINPALADDGPYTQTYLTTAAGSVNFIIDSADIVPLSGSRPYWNEFTGGAWQQTLMSNNYYMSVWVGAIPLAADTHSQKLRYIFLQGQSESATLAGQQALSASDVTLGTLQDLTPEFVFTNQVILKYTGGNWTISEVRALTGSKANQTSSPAGNYLTAVSSDATLTGLGTSSSPLGIDLANPNTWTGLQTLVGTNITGLPAASVLAGIFGTGAYVMDTSLAVPQLGASGDTDLLTLAADSLIINGTTEIVTGDLIVPRNREIQFNDGGEIRNLIKYTSADDTITIGENTGLIDYLYLGNGYNVGINETTPTTELEVNGQLKIGNGAGAATANNLMVFDNTTNRFIKIGVDGSDVAKIAVDNADDLQFGTLATVNNDFTTFVPLMHMDHNGNVGIGTTNPTVLLDVRGDAIFNEDGASVDFRIESDGNANMFFVDGSANSIGIGTASPSQLFHTYLGTSGDKQAFFEKYDESSANAVVRILQDSSVGTVPCLELDQDDESEGFIDFVGSDRGAVQTGSHLAIPVSSVASVRVEINGTKYVIPLFADQ